MTRLLATIAVAAATLPHPATRLLVFVAPSRPGTHARHGLFLTDRRGHVLRVLSSASYGTIGRWSPSGAQIAWKDPAGIHIAKADGSGARLLIATAAACKACQALSFVWSADSRALAVGSAGPEGNELRLVPIDGSAPRVLAASTIAGTFFTPMFWTPDGTSLVYGEEGTSLAYPGAVTRALDLATGRTRTIWSTPTSQDSHPPLLSPDLREWAYISEVDQYHQRLRIVDTATHTTHVVRGVNPTNLVGWAPNSRSLAVVERGWHVVIVSRNGTVLHRIGPGLVSSWGRDGELFVLRRRYDRVWVSENGRPETFLFASPRNTWVVSLDAN